ncbi:hypothetical protein [Hymenobacter sp. AT01-02]|uniref:hypothetical protein n=1 Tax=Hymenobacter sp. AT01-02 TaxID=1571877 RepID=UPI0005F1CB86|nr:hypothetical protein [Hymenobacter sp. AT01-02]
MFEHLSYSGSLRKTIVWSGVVTYIVLAVLAIVFYKERVAFVDLSFHLFTILQEDTLTIQNYRFGSAITQLVPLLGGRLGLSLHTVTILYSLAFVGWYASVFAFCVWGARAVRWGTVVVLLSTLMVTHTFYWAQSELQQGLVFMVLFLAVYQRWLVVKWPGWGVPALSIGLFTLCFFHPTLFIPFSFCCLFFVLRNRDSYTSYLWLLGAMLALTYIKNKVFHTPYDIDNIKRTDKLFSLFPNYFNTYAFQRFLNWLVYDYYLLSLGLILVIAHYAWQKQWLRMALSGGAFLAYALLVTGSYSEGQEPQFYMENLLLPLAVFVAVPLAFDVLPSLPARWAAGMVVMVLALRLLSIGFAHVPYSNRVAWAQRLLHHTENLPNRKLLLPEQGVPMDTVMMTWATPYEFWLLSSLEEPQQARSICISSNPDEKMPFLNKPQSFLATWGLFDYSQLPARYFPFPTTDTTSYKRTTYAELMPSGGPVYRW